MNMLVEEWGGEYQSKDISAKTGQGVDELLEEILTRAELMELKANPNRLASGTVLEASLEKGKGYTANLLIQNGTLRVGDYVVAGRNHGKVRAMYDERGNRIKEAGPSMPVQIIGLDGAPRAGDKFKVYADEKEAKKIAQKRDQIYREQQLRARRHITLDEIGRRLELGEFKELNLIIKGDVDGSVEALSDALVKLSNEKVEVRIIHKGVGQITEADVNLAAASDAIIIGFNVRPSGKAAQLAQEEGVQIKTYSIIYEGRCEGGIGKHAFARRTRGGHRNGRSAADLQNFQSGNGGRMYGYFRKDLQQIACTCYPRRHRNPRRRVELAQTL